MGHGFDIVAIRIEDKSAVVVCVIVRPKPGRPVCLPAGCQGGTVERFQFIAVLRRKRDMQSAFEGRACSDPELRPLTSKSSVTVSIILGELHFLEKIDTQRR